MVFLANLLMIFPIISVGVDSVTCTSESFKVIIITIFYTFRCLGNRSRESIPGIT